MRRGFTLIELMISVALIGIAVGSMGAATSFHRSTAVSLVLRERAMQLLEARADALVRSTQLAPDDEQALLNELPRGALTERVDGGLRILTASWNEASGKQTVELVLVESHR